MCNMIILTFFFLLFTGKYTGTKYDSTPLPLCGVGLRWGKCVINGATASEAGLNTATLTALVLITQNNGLQEEVIGQGVPKDPLLCPNTYLVRRILHLCINGRTSTSDLGRSFTDGNCSNVTPIDISKTLNTSATFLGLSLGF